jgi:hypothetical protein
MNIQKGLQYLKKFGPCFIVTCGLIQRNQRYNILTEIYKYPPGVKDIFPHILRPGI